jgi:8-oxo-dGTP diphosphatase
MPIQNFNLRVYGLLIQDDKVLVTHEHRAGIIMTKFPGGGLEKGEGLAEGLKREFIEEMNLEVEVKDIFYVNEFLQISSFNEADQLISFYFRVESHDHSSILLSSDKASLKKGQQIFEWVSIKDLRKEEFTFPIDRVVVERLASGASASL